MADVLKRVLMAINDHHRKHGSYPQRITVSQEIARELDAEYMLRQETFLDVNCAKPRTLANGDQMFVRGIPVVADLSPDVVLDIRD